MYDPHFGKIDIAVYRARGTAHPPVLHSMAFTPDQGVLPAGLLLQASASGLVPYDPDGAEAVAGVNDAAVDTAMQDSGLVIIHGSALRERLTVKVADSFVDADETILAALIKTGVYPE